MTARYPGRGLLGQTVEAIRAGNPAAADEAMRRLLDEAARDLSNTRGDIQGDTRGGT